MIAKILSHSRRLLRRSPQKVILKRSETGPGENLQSVDVSVVMPSLNQVEFIERAIRSVLSQADELALELIVMDGGSRDGTQDILARLTSEAKGRLRWYSEGDHGPAHAINKALKKARGDIIGWINSDDRYTPGAVRRAVDALQERPEWWMVYGRGQHIDACDASIGDYPTRGPDTPLQAFADGCFICQPTVFFRRQLFDELGGLDESLKTAFDFELWLRLFQRHSERVGFVDEIQAQSRLHLACLTLAQRETVIREGMQLIARYLGECPVHWVRTYIDDVMALYPHGKEIRDVRGHLAGFLDSVSGYLSSDELKKANGLLEDDARVRLATRDAYLEVYPDGWLSTKAKLRLQGKNQRWKRVRLRGKHVFKSKRPLSFTVHSPDGSRYEYTITRKGRFTLDIPIPTANETCAYWTYYIESEGGFVPREYNPDSNDNRELACRIESMRLMA